MESNKIKQNYNIYSLRINRINLFFHLFLFISFLLNQFQLNFQSIDSIQKIKLQNPIKEEKNLKINPKNLYLNYKKQKEKKLNKEKQSNNQVLRFLNDDGDKNKNHCQAPCGFNKCVTHADNCTECNGGYYKIHGHGFPTKCYNGLHGYYLHNNEWHGCSGSCNGCQGNSSNCNGCAGGYRKFSYRNFPTQCYTSYANHFINGNDLHPCDSSCNGCTNSAKNCLKCNSYFYKFIDKNFPTECYEIKNPPSGRCYYSGSWQTCSSNCTGGCSHENCLKCNKCNNGFYPEENKSFPTFCYNKYDGYFLENYLWKKCDASCKTCTGSKTNCLSCNSNFYIKYGTSFPTKCHGLDLFNQGFYVDQSANVWKECDYSGCKNCKISEINCTACDAGKYLKFGNHNPNTCNSSLDQYFLKDNFLHPCDPSCDNCITSKTNCKNCADGYYKKPETNYPTLCYKCDKSCSTCIENEFKCKVCSKDYYPKIDMNYPTNCYNKITSWFLRENKWNKCDKSCHNCTGSEKNCSECSSGFYKKFNTNFPTMCYDKIPKYYLSENVWKNCDASCANCVTNPTNCTECEKGYWRKIFTSFPTKCYNFFTSWFVDFTSVPNTFKQCDVSCYNCITNKTNCTQCANGYYYLEDKKNCFLPSKSPDGYYYDKNYQLHKLCDVSCYSCSSKFFCTKCAENYFPLVDEVSKCINKDIISYTHPSTKVSYFYNKDLKNYSKCGESCKTCKLKEDHCLICNYEGDYFHLEDKRETCLKECPDFYFRNFLKKECSNCHISCKKCFDTQPKCEECAPEYYPLSDNIQKCYKERPNKTYVFDTGNKNWYKCKHPGLYCDEKFRYIECVEKYFLLEHEFKCLEKCPEGYWGDSSIKKCVKCSSPCNFCENKFTCKTCIKDHYFIKEFQEQNCVEKCPEGFWPFENKNISKENPHEKICKKCNPECTTCLTDKICLTCADNFFHNPDTKTCKEKCDDGYLEDQENKSCLKCDKNCKTCEEKIDQCTSCQNSYLNQNLNKCVANCPNGMYNDKIWNTCEFCHKTCLTCSGNREKECLSCPEEKGIKLLYGYCTKGCPGDEVREIDGRGCINFKDCFKSVFLSVPKVFSITENNFEAKLILMVKDECLPHKKNFEYKWDETENAEIEGDSLMIPNDKLKDGEINLGILVKYNSVGIIKVKGKSTLITFKLIPDIKNEENLKTIWGYEIKIDASLSHDEGYKEKTEKDKELNFKWKCSFELESLCENKTDSILLIKKSEYERLIRKPTSNKNYEIELILTKDKRISKKKVNLKLKKPPEINKKRNEDIDITELMTISPSNAGGEKDITFLLSFDLPSIKFKDFTYFWTVNSFKNDKQYLNTRNENRLKVSMSDLLIGINEINLRIYDIKNKKYFLKVYKYKKPIPPYGGRCTVSPQNGVSLKDDFEFITSDWVTNKNPLLYKIYFQGENDNFIDITTGGFMEHKYTTKNLLVGDKYFLEAIDAAGLKARTPCYVTALPNKNLKKYEEYLVNIFDPLKQTLILEIYKSNTKANGGLENKNDEKEENYVDPRIAINDSQIQMLYNLLISEKEQNNVQGVMDHVIVSLLNVTPEPYSDIKIQIVFDSFEIIIENVEPIIKKDEMIKSIYEIGDNLSQRITNANSTIISEENKTEKIEKIQGSYKIINDLLFGNIVSGESLEIKTPAIDVKLTKASSLNVPKVSMEYEEENFKLKKNKRFKLRKLNNNNKNDTCDVFTAICLDKEKMKLLMNESNTENIGFKGELNKNVTLPIEQEQFSNSMNFDFSDENENEKEENVSKTKKRGRLLFFGSKNVTTQFEVRLKLPRDRDIDELGPLTCVQYEKNSRRTNVTCISFYDMEAKETICQCTRQGLTVNVKDKIISQLSKLRQFPAILHSFFNKYSLGIVGGFIALFIFTNIIAVIYDSIDYSSMKYQMLEDYDYLQFYLNKYHSQGFDKGLNFFWLYIYMVKSLHPIWSILHIYHPGYPRTLRVMDYFLQIYLTFFFTFLRFYIFGNPKAEKFMNDRSLRNKGKTINSLSYTIEEKMWGVLYSIIASIITAIVTQVLQLWLYKNVIRDDLKRKTLILRKNMCALDKDYTPLYKIKLKKTFFRIKTINLLLPNNLRKNKIDLPTEKKCFTLNNIENDNDMEKDFNNNKLPIHNEYNSENFNLIANKNNKNDNDNNEISFCENSNKSNTNMEIDKQNASKNFYKNEKETEKEKKSTDYENTLKPNKAIDFKRLEASNFKKHLGNLLNMENEDIKHEKKRENLMKDTILSKNQNDNNYFSNHSYAKSFHSANSHLIKDRNNQDDNIYNNNDNSSKQTIFTTKAKSKLDKENIVIPREFNSNNFNSNLNNEDDFSERSLIKKINDNNSNYYNNYNNREIVKYLDDNSQISNNSIISDITKLKKKESIDITENKKEKENSKALKLKGLEDKNFKNNKNLIKTEKFHFKFLRKKKYNKLNKNNPNQKKVYTEISLRERLYIFGMNKNKENKDYYPICFQITIKKLVNQKRKTHRFQNFLKAFIVLALYFSLWIAMSIFINNLVEKYGNSTFGMCIFPVFYMFLVKLIIIVNIQYLIMTIILYKKGKVYLNQQKRSLFDMVLFKGLVHPMALDHFASIIHYQEYLRNSRFKF